MLGLEEENPNLVHIRLSSLPSKAGPLELRFEFELSKYDVQ
jgi:hypothetical protein